MAGWVIADRSRPGYAMPSMALLAKSHWWARTSAFFGAVYIAILTLLVPPLGAPFLSLFVERGFSSAPALWRSAAKRSEALVGSGVFGGAIFRPSSLAFTSSAKAAS